MSVPLERLLQRQGEDVLRSALIDGGRPFRDALRACRRCRSAEPCRSFLDSVEGDAYPPFCPNAGFIEHTRSLVY